MTPGWAYATLSQSGACRVTLKPMPKGFGTGSSLSEPREGMCWATAPRRVRSRFCVEPEWIDDSCLRSLTRQRPNTGSACRGRTFPSSARQSSIMHPPHLVLLFVPDLLTEVRRAFPEVEDSGGRWVDAEALRA